jgi:diguanylate cyclase (GGDEF)-like protein
MWYVLLVDTTAFVALVVMATRTGWRLEPAVTWLTLAAGAAISVETYRRVGAMHRGSNRRFLIMLSAFFLAGAVLLPPFYAMLLPIPINALAQARALRLDPMKRVFNTAMMVLACLAAVGVREAIAPVAGFGVTPSGSFTTGWQGPISVLLAVVVLVMVNELLLFGIMRLLSPLTPWREHLGDAEGWTLNMVDAAAGVGLALAWAASPVFFVVLLGPVVLLQRNTVYRYLVQASQTDAKTGVASPSHWRRVAGRAVTRVQHSGGSLGVMMVDLDHFKGINDRFGHLAGDEVLIAVADTLRLAVRPDDLVGRFGGEEFSVLLTGATLAEATEAADRLHQRISVLGGRTGSAGDVRSVTASIGVAVFGHHGVELDELIEAADTALYRAKAAGRNQIVVAEAAQRVPDTTFAA